MRHFLWAIGAVLLLLIGAQLARADWTTYSGSNLYGGGGAGGSGDSGIRIMTSAATSISAGATNTIGPINLATDGAVITETPTCTIVGTDNVATAEYCCPCGGIRTSDGVSCDFAATTDAGVMNLLCRNWNATTSRTANVVVRGLQ